MKKVLSLFLSVLMLTSVVAAVDLSAYAEQDSDYTYSVRDGGAQITGYIGSETDLVIPSEIDGYTVTSISIQAFYDYSTITSVIIPDSVTSLGYMAFYRCKNLLSVVVGDGVTSIGWEDFYDCENLKNVTLGSNVTSIANEAFSGCLKLESINIPDGLTTIGEKAFYACFNLSSLVLPDSVTSIGDNAFYGCPNIAVSDSNSTFCSVDGVIFSKDKTELVFCSCSKSGSYVIPDSVVSIRDYAFALCTNLTGITIPDGVTSIAEYTFFDCSELSFIEFSSNIKSIDSYAFYKCSNLTDLTIPDGVTSIADSVFLDCTGLTNITIGNNLKVVGKNAFNGCTNLSNVYFKGSESEWGDITISSGNDKLTSAYFYYNSPGCCSVHTWGDCIVISEPTCTSTGTVEYICTICSTPKYEYTGKIEHDYEYVRTEPTCTKTGSIKKTCTLCGYVDSTETLAATGHSYDGGTVTKEATCKATGSKTYTCTVCGSTKKETIDKLTTHSYENKITKAKYDSNGGSNGKIEKKCSVCKNVKSTTTIYKPKSMSLSTTSYTYNGKAKKPTITVKDSKGNKISSKYYTVSYISRSTGKKVSSMKNPGKYYVKVTFKTRYSGSIKKAVTIKPKKTSIKKITASKKGFTVKWGKVSTQNTGYQIQYSTSKSFKNAKTAIIKKTGTISKKVTKLKAKKKYYVRVRTYKTVKVNGKSTKLYSAWSSTKGVTTKK